MNVIEINNFTKQYKDVLAVNDISLNIKSGMITGFVGKNGAGKTTTIRALLNFINPTSGDLKVLGLDSNKQSSLIKQSVSYMASDTEFYKNLTPLDIFKFVCKLNGTSLDEALKYAKYFELNINKQFKSLSLGNKKKVGIVQSLLKDNKLIILDEPTNGLDPLMQVKFFELILQLKAKGVAVFLSSHNLSEIEKYCDRVIFIKDGVIVEDLMIDEVVANRKQEVTYTLSNGDTVKYHFDGDINVLLKELVNLNISNLEIKNISMEEEFMKYYMEDDYE